MWCNSIELGPGINLAHHAWQHLWNLKLGSCPLPRCKSLSTFLLKISDFKGKSSFEFRWLGEPKGIVLVFATFKTSLFSWNQSVKVFLQFSRYVRNRFAIKMHSRAICIQTYRTVMTSLCKIINKKRKQEWLTPISQGGGRGRDIGTFDWQRGGKRQPCKEKQIDAELSDSLSSWQYMGWGTGHLLSWANADSAFGQKLQWSQWKLLPLIPIYWVHMQLIHVF